MKYLAFLVAILAQCAYSSAQQLPAMDLIHRLLKRSADKHSFEYQHYYRSGHPAKYLYLKTENLSNPPLQHAVALVNTDDSAIACYTFIRKNKKWVQSKSIIIGPQQIDSRFLYAISDDYNFDGANDLYINLYSTNRISQNFGCILTFSKKTKSFTPHSETLSIPDIEIDRKHKLLFSVCRDKLNCDIYGQQENYSWVNGSLKYHSKTIKKLGNKGYIPKKLFSVHVPG